LEKALREAKRTTSWIEPDAAWEGRVAAFCRAIVEDEAFLADFVPFAETVARAGDRAALGQLLLKLTVPGVPDVYQGDELLALSLVDPDNRRPVDWEARRAALAAVRAGAAPTHRTRKLWLIRRALDLRARRPEPFAGAYAPLEAGPDAIAFLRGDGDGEVLAATALRPGGEAASIAVPAGAWRDVLTGAERRLAGPTPLAELLDEHGIALLERVDA
jgi:(1->4)-alpha-D-glucan 1-alpha-D-glucosylmutase